MTEKRAPGSSGGAGGPLETRGGKSFDLRVVDALVRDRTRELEEQNRLLAERLAACEQAERRLRENEARYHLLAERVSDMISWHDSEGRFLHASPSCRVVTGYEPEELVGRSGFDDIHPEDLPTVRAMYDRLLRGEMPAPVVFRRRNRDGDDRWVEVTTRPVMDEATGQLKEVLCHTCDITEQREAEQIARQRQEELAHVGRLNTMGRMVSELAHELNQPLTAIVNFVQGARRRLAESGLTKEQAAEVLDRIGAQADRAGQIIRRLHRFVQKRKPQRAQVKVNHLVDEILGLLEPQIRSQSIQVQRELAPDLPTVWVDSVQIGQVLLNVVRNAMEAMEKVPVGQRWVRVATWREAGELVMSVQDGGEGVSEEQVAQLFEPFFTTKPQGMGMGLAISASIAKAHGGRLEALRAAEGGMEFRLCLSCSVEGTR